MPRGGIARTYRPFDADVAARAVIAAAHSYGDDPMLAMTATTNHWRRSLSAAVSGLCVATGAPPSKVGPMFGVNDCTVSAAQKRNHPDFARARTAAERAVTAVLGPWPAPKRLSADPKPPALTRKRFEQIRAAKDVVKEVAPAAETAPAIPDNDDPYDVPVRRRDPTRSGQGADTFTNGRVAPPNGLLLPDRIMAALADKPMNPMTLAFMVDAKELAVTQALDQLAREGVVQAGSMPLTGRRFQCWRLV